MVSGENKDIILKLFFNIQWQYVDLIYTGLGMDNASEMYNKTSASIEYKKV
jgi:hypothetical protein